MLTVKLILERLDKDGRLLERREQQSKSFLIQFIQFLQQAHDYLDLSIQDITDTSKTARKAVGSNLRIASPGGWGAVVAFGTNLTPSSSSSVEGEKIGIVVGTGDVAAAPDDYHLGARIVHGNGAGEFEYGGTELLPLVVADPNAEFTIRRYFTNNSGNPITVYEVGIYAAISDSDRAYPACIARDVVGAGVAVADTEILRVTYVPQITV